MRYGKGKKIAEWLGVSRPYFSRLKNETLRPSPKKAMELEGVSGIDVKDWLLLEIKQLMKKIEVAYEIRCNS